MLIDGQFFRTGNLSSAMKSFFYQLMRYIRKKMWAIVVAYMLGMHNFYTGEDKKSDDIVITIEYNEVQENGTPPD